MFKPDDFDDYFSFRLLSLQQAPHMFASDAQSWQAASPQALEQHLLNSQSRKAPILGVWQDDKVIALTGLNRSFQPTVAHKATLWGLFVSAAHRRQGVATQLLAFAMKTAQELGSVRQLRAVVNATSQEAIGLFEKVGFKRFGLEPRAKLVDGTFHDQIYFWCPLNDGL
ncbi:MAG: GNAT family N-acetyltransferase [Chloroflexota bacterium]